MFFYLLFGHFATIFLSTNYTTNLSFEHPIEKVIYGGAKNEVFTYLSKDKKTLTLKALQENIKTNLTIIGSEGLNSSNSNNGHFWIAIDQNNPHVYVQIRAGSVDQSYKKVFANEQIEILEGEKSTLICNKTEAEQVINQQKIPPNSKEYFSKGIPFIDAKGTRIYN